MTRQDNFVPALRDPMPRVVEVEIARELPAAPIVPPMPYSNHVDRATGFSIATGPLAGAAGIVAAIVGIIGWQVPIASLITLLLALAGFSLVWLIAYLGHVIISSDGALIIHTVMGWNYLKREQRERHRRYASIHEGVKHE